MDSDKIKDFMVRNKSGAMALAVVLAIGVVATGCPRDNRNSNGTNYNRGYHGGYFFGGGRRSTIWSSGNTNSSSYSSGSHFSS